MGSPDTEANRESDEGPVHSVTITYSFYIKQTEVTQGEWKSLIGNNPSGFGTCGDNCSVEMVNWYEAVYYANALSESEGFESCYTISGCLGTLGSGNQNADNYECTVTHLNVIDCKGYRLPTEAEWEYAARAGTSGSRYGDLNAIAWHKGNSSGTTHPVGETTANAWGLYDVLGNVNEWVNDWSDDNYYSTCSSGCIDPTGPPAGSTRVSRGADWDSITSSVRLANRCFYQHGLRRNYIGIRLARTVP